MTETEERAAKIADVKERIRKLNVRTTENGCTEAEALMAFEMVGRLLDMYSLNMDEVMVRAETCVTGKTTGRDDINRPIELCMWSVFRFTEVRGWNQHDGRTARTYCYHGFPADVEMTGFLLAMIEQAFYYGLRVYIRENPGSDDLATRLKEFEAGMAMRLNERLTDMRKDRDVQTAERTPPKLAHGATGTALALVKKNLVEEAFELLGLKLRKGRAKAAVSQTGAFHAGARAGGAVNLGRPLGGRSAPLAIR